MLFNNTERFGCFYLLCSVSQSIFINVVPLMPNCNKNAPIDTHFQLNKVELYLIGFLVNGHQLGISES